MKKQRIGGSEIRLRETAASDVQTGFFFFVTIQTDAAVRSGSVFIQVFKEIPTAKQLQVQGENTHVITLLKSVVSGQGGRKSFPIPPRLFLSEMCHV